MASIILTQPIQPSSGSSGLDGLSIADINSVPMLVQNSPLANGQRLSVAEQSLVYSDLSVANLDWLPIGNTSDASSGYVAEYDGAVVGISVHCENTNNNIARFRIFVDDADTGTVITINDQEEAKAVNTFLGVSFLRGQKIRVRATLDSGVLQDTIVKLTIKWRVSTDAITATF